MRGTLPEGRAQHKDANAAKRCNYSGPRECVREPLPNYSPRTVYLVRGFLDIYPGLDQEFVS
jgi:hypothetical protein